MERGIRRIGWPISVGKLASAGDYTLKFSERRGYSLADMSRGMRQRAPTGTILCWLLAVSIAGISAAIPVLGADLASDSSGAHHVLAGEAPALPSWPGGAPRAAIDDLSGPAAAAIFRLASPAIVHHAASCPPAPRLQTRAQSRALERGPPAGVG